MIEPSTKHTRWALWRGLRHTWRAFRRDSAQLPRGAWKRWAIVIASGSFLCAALMAAMTLFAQWLAERGMQEWDEAKLQQLITANFISEHDAIWFQSWGTSSMQLPLLIIAVVTCVMLRRPVWAASYLAVYIGHVLLVNLGWWMWARPRPIEVEAVFGVPTAHTFPSGHAANAICLYGLLGYAWFIHSRSMLERALIVLLVAAVVAIVGVARLRQQMHYPSDVIAGVIIGGAWLAVVIAALRASRARG